MTAILPDRTTTTTRTGEHGATSFLPSDARERLEPKLREAVSEFVDSPAEAVEKADRLLAETVEQLHQALVHRHGELRSAWNGKGDAGKARSAGSPEPTRHDDGTGFGDATGPGGATGFGDGTPSGAGAGLREGREGAGPRDDRDRTGTARDADRDGVTDDGTGLSGAASAARKPGATTGAGTGAGSGVPGDGKTTSGVGNGTEADTERLRLALQEYRETTERLLSL